MWHRPDMLDALAAVLCALGAALAAYAGAHAVANLPAFQLREVRLARAPLHVTRAEIEAIVMNELRGGFFTLDLAAARAAFGRLAWVRGVSVRRRWPGGLEVALDEHVPLARWGERALVNVQGEVFEATYEGPLPRFSGPAGTAKEIAIQYQYFRRRLAEIGQVPVRLHVSPRRAWEVQLANGMTLALGRAETEARLARFIAVYGRTVAPLRRRIDYVDLRYANGFAVRVPELAHEPAPGRTGAGRKRRGRA